MLVAVLTTIQPPTLSMASLAERLERLEAQFVVIGDEPGPSSYDVSGVRFLPLSAQLKQPFRIARMLPQRHYARKNLGYLQALRSGASCIYETDDDNTPLPRWAPRTKHVNCVESGNREWLNVYRWFTREKIWPRGFPLDEVDAATRDPLEMLGSREEVSAPIQQGLANGSPDVDAVWRLTAEATVEFEDNESILVRPGSWCPFNSQSTWWWSEAFPLLYLPSHCSFRMTDIWRSFVAQRCLWELNAGVVFHAPEVSQQRNYHNLMKDFALEVEGYLHNKRLATVLERLGLEKGQAAVGANLEACYAALVDADLIDEMELTLVRAWLQDVESVL